MNGSMSLFGGSGSLPEALVGTGSFSALFRASHQLTPPRNKREQVQVWANRYTLFPYFEPIGVTSPRWQRGKRRRDVGMQKDIMPWRHGIVAARKISLRSDLEDPFVAPGMWCHQQKGVVEHHGPCNSPNESS